MSTRIEKDSLGPLEVPAEAYYGVQTQRAVTNFPISGWPLPPRLVHAMGRIKRAAAQTNLALGLVDQKISKVDRPKPSMGKRTFLPSEASRLRNFTSIWMWWPGTCLAYRRV